MNGASGTETGVLNSLQSLRDHFLDCPWPEQPPHCCGRRRNVPAIGSGSVVAAVDVVAADVADGVGPRGAVVGECL